MPRYRLILLNDDTHTYGYVAGMLRDVLGIREEVGFRLAERVDRHGGAVILTGTLDEVEAAGRAVLGYGPDPDFPRSDGPMAVAVEPVE